MSSGNITRRGKTSWRLKYEAGERDAVTGKRSTRFVTVRGTKKDAQRQLIRLLAEVENGSAIDPTRVTVAEYLKDWLDTEPVIGAKGKILSPKTLERYRQLRDEQIIPHLGSTLLQSLKPAQINKWHSTLLGSGGTNGGALAPRSVGHAHRLLHAGLERAVKLELLSRNVAHVIHPPEVDDDEIVILTEEQITDVLSRKQHSLHAIATLALGSGMRRGELCALRWPCLDLDKAQVRVEGSLEQTKPGLRFKGPKTKNSRRTITLSASTVEVLRAYRRWQLEQRMMLGLGKLGDDDLVFGRVDGSPYPPNTLSRDWWRAGLAPVEFHALRHTHASVLIAAGVDVVTVSKRLGHSSPAITLKIYAHLFRKLENDTRSAEAIEAAMIGKSPA